MTHQSQRLANFADLVASKPKAQICKGCSNQQEPSKRLIQKFLRSHLPENYSS